MPVTQEAQATCERHQQEDAKRTRAGRRSETANVESDCNYKFDWRPSLFQDSPFSPGSAWLRSPRTHEQIVLIH
eukprot:10715340-Karenia_brevis.AAC.1